MNGDLTSTRDHPRAAFQSVSALHCCKFPFACATIRVYPERPMVVTVHIGSQVTAVAGAGLEPAISAYETERITIFHIPQYKIKDSTKRLLGFMNLIVVRTRFELVTLP